MARIVKLNVGGTKYATSISTIMKFPESMLGTLIQQPREIQMIEDGQEIFIDRNGRRFKYVLEYFRDGPDFVLPTDISTLKEIFLESRYFMLDGLNAIVKKKLDESNRMKKYGWKVGDHVLMTDMATWPDYAVRMHGFRILGEPIGTVVHLGNGGKAVVQFTSWYEETTATNRQKESIVTHLVTLKPKSG